MRQSGHKKSQVFSTDGYAIRSNRPQRLVEGELSVTKAMISDLAIMPTAFVVR